MVVDDAFRRRLLRKSMLLLAGIVLCLGVVMFVPAGIGWRRGWVFLATFCVYTFLSAAYLWRVNPEIYVARSQVHEGTKPWDKAVMAVLLMSLVAIFFVAGLDTGRGWSAVLVPMVALGYVLFTIGFAVTTWVYAVNKFAEPSVRIQSDRGHAVIDTGPYAIVRHPLYSASIVLFIGMALAMGSYWAMVPVAVGSLVLVVRTSWEDRVLQRELAGYMDFVSRVRYRLVPGIW